MSQRTETVVIGAGSAGLSCNHHLALRQREHVVIEQDRIAETWRTRRWDGFRLNTPSFLLNLPGRPYDGDDPEGPEKSRDGRTSGAVLGRQRRTGA
jgi:putative flavoprotein involved in K+ transport